MNKSLVWPIPHRFVSPTELQIGQILVRTNHYGPDDQLGEMFKIKHLHMFVISSGEIKGDMVLEDADGISRSYSIAWVSFGAYALCMNESDFWANDLVVEV